MKFPRYSVVGLALLLSIFSIGFILHTFSHDAEHDQSYNTQRTPFVVHSSPISSHNKTKVFLDGVMSGGKNGNRSPSVNNHLHLVNNISTITQLSTSNIATSSPSLHTGDVSKDVSKPVITALNMSNGIGRINVQDSKDRGCLGDGVFIVITRSVVQPKKRRERLQVIGETWGKDLVSTGARVSDVSTYNKH